MNILTAIILSLVCLSHSSLSEEEIGNPAYGRVTDLIVASRHEIFILDMSHDSEKAEKIWTWQVTENLDVPEDIRSKLTGFAEAKHSTPGKPF